MSIKGKSEHSQSFRDQAVMTKSYLSEDKSTHVIAPLVVDAKDDSKNEEKYNQLRKDQEIENAYLKDRLKNLESKLNLLKKETVVAK